MPRRLLAAVPLIVGTALLTSCGAGAGTATPVPAGSWRGVDAVGDVRGTEHRADPAPCGTDTPVDADGARNVDLTGLTIAAEPDALRLTASIADLGHGDVNVTFRVRTSSQAYDMSVTRSRHYFANGRSRVMTDADWLGTPPSSPPDPSSCGRYVSFGPDGPRCHVTGAVVDDDGTVTTTIPRSCLGDPSTVQVGVRTYAHRPGYVPAPPPDEPTYDYVDSLGDGAADILSPLLDVSTNLPS